MSSHTHPSPPKLFGFPLTEHEEIPERKHDVEEDRSKFKCYYCKRVYTNSQALGGHQNAHKKDRQRERRFHAIRSPSRPPVTVPSMYLQGSTSGNPVAMFDHSQQLHSRPILFPSSTYHRTSSTPGFPFQFYGSPVLQPVADVGEFSDKVVESDVGVNVDVHLRLSLSD